MNEEILKLVGLIQEFFKKEALTLSTAESCTGGLISHYLTAVSGASAFFKAGIVTYSVESKKKILGISPEIILRHGVVSKETAREMAEKVRLLAQTDYSISTTGNLGPGLLEDKEKGLVYIAISKKREVFSRRLQLAGNREENKKATSLSALKFLIEMAKM